jgi:hypothetical protein
LDVLRQQLWDFPERADLRTRSALPFYLFVRQILHPQIGFQRHISQGFVREAALLAAQDPGNVLRRLFEQKTGIGVSDFLDLALATYVAILNGGRRFNLAWFAPLVSTYSSHVIDAFVRMVSRTFDELLLFFRNLPDAKQKVASELFEFPVVSRYPFLRTANLLECWHPQVFYRGIEGLVHTILSEEGQVYMDRFGKIFEKHVTGEAKRVSAPFLDEHELITYMPRERKVPDGILSFPGCNVMVESKAGIFDESVMTVGHSEMFSHKTRALKGALFQAWSASVSLRAEKRAPKQVLEAEKDYLLVVTNKELSTSNGKALTSMYPPGSLDPPNPEALRFLPREHIFVLSVEAFERLVAAASNASFDLPSFLETCVQADQKPESAVFFFEQHLDRERIPRQFSELVTNTLQKASSRVEQVLKSSGGGGQ